MLFCIALNAQESVEEEVVEAYKNPIKIGLKGGLSLPSLSDNSDNIYTQDFKSYVSFETGLFAEYGFSDLLSLQVELNYTVKGGERTGSQPIPAAQLEGQLPPDIALPSGTVLYAEFNNKSALEYIEIPILAKFTFGEDWKFFGNIGPYAGFLVGATQKTSGTSNISADIPGVGFLPNLLPDEVSFNAETDVSDSIKNFNFGGIAGIGVIKTVSSHSEILFEVRGTYGFIPVQEDETFGESRIGSVVFSLGYAYKL
ncbi:porin family protein [Lacinutrix iliipiscaria]|uniref:Porin family protein n=1 Tax=Lacinutrix iliipiscaria TaxID=1230532 RepID=A0ABW5WMT7_9FLAO